MTDTGGNGRGAQLVELGADVLSSVLHGTPLPGLGRRVQLADIALARDDEGVVRVLDEGLTSQVAARVAAGDGEGLRLVTAEALVPKPGELVGALRVRAEMVDDTVRVTVETCVRRDPSEDVRAIEALSVTFVEHDGRWIVADDPRHLAT